MYSRRCDSKCCVSKGCVRNEYLLRGSVIVGMLETWGVERWGWWEVGVVRGCVLSLALLARQKKREGGGWC